MNPRNVNAVCSYEPRRRPPFPAWGPTLLATGIAFVIGYAAVSWLLKYISHNSFIPFVVYRVLLGLTIIGLFIAGALDPDAGAMG
ncbi:undecaprenyl-diphosphate phosphatase [Streptomyces sp. NPDC057746]|uniref:undecaprenyl-diphosphate phosphatase n=1 Tax=Streptomyces sp. NPDC057746 TaxID=3346237 RepID=UPI003681D650